LEFFNTPTSASQVAGIAVPAPTFSTFQTMDLTRKRCPSSGLLQEPRRQALKDEEPPPSSGTLAVHASLLPETASVPGNTEKAEEVPGEDGLSLQAEILAWFQKTQAHWLLQQGTAPAWFHGFITRRQAQACVPLSPLGCLNLPSPISSPQIFCLSPSLHLSLWLSPLRDGRHVVLGEDSAHAQLQDLLRHYTECPLSPYGETLTRPLARQTPEPAGLSLRTEESDSGSHSQNPSPQHNPDMQQGQAPALPHKEGAWEPKEGKGQNGPACLTPFPSPKLAPLLFRGQRSSPVCHLRCPQGRGTHSCLPLPSSYAVLPLMSSSPCLGLSFSLQNPGGPQRHSENSGAGQGLPLPQQPPLPWRHTLPHNLSRQVLQDRGQAWLPVGPPL
uniref:SH2 domain containing 2A n=1 Tax=Spermophilus dauricus TaxID=99837 RepID=A0A8C9QJM5_SPEDA